MVVQGLHPRRTDLKVSSTVNGRFRCRPFVFNNILALFREFVGATLVVARGGHKGHPYDALT